MKKIKLTYFKKSSNKPLSLYFEKTPDLFSWMNAIIEYKIKIKDRVYLFTYNSKDSDCSMDSECIITENIDFIYKVINPFISGLDFNYVTDFHLHEYDSYEDAYLVAKDMKEGNALCYGL